MLAAAGWLWSGLGPVEWLVTVVAQTVVGFVLIALILTPLWGRLKDVYRDAKNPYTPGGAGDVLAPDGSPMYEYLAERTAGDD